MRGMILMLKNIFTNIQDKYNNIKQENAILDQLLQTTTTFQNLFPITNKKQEISEHKIKFLLEDCPDLNKEKATLITNLIPINQTFLTAIYSIEIITNKEYYIIPTNQYLWVISPTHYGIFQYDTFPCQIIKNNLMSKSILFGNILLEANGTKQKFDTFLNIINTPTERQTIIKEKTSYLQGILPIYQKINKLGTGISLDEQFNIIFHTKEKNLKVKKEELLNYEILLDNQVYLSKNSTTSKNITNFQTSCYQISIRITTTNNTLIMPILEPNTFGNKYSAHDSIFEQNLTFAKTITQKLDSLTKPNY